MPRRTTKKKGTSGKRRRTQRGKGTLGDIGNFIRDNKLISKGLGMIPHPAGQLASRVAGLVGLGRRRKKTAATRKKRATASRRKRTAATPSVTYGKMRGRGIFSDLGGGIGNVFGGLGGGLGSVAHGLFGSGRKRGTARRRNIIAI